MTPLTLDAPAKLNLSLEIRGKRPDGYHELETLMVTLPGLADQLSISPADTFSFTCDDAALPTDGSNLVVKATRAFESAIGKSCPFHIQLRKRVPHGAGLGGGSSDAASALLALNRLHDHPLTAEALGDLAAGLGSDIPFFLTPGPSWCSGRGEIVRPAKPFGPLPVLLLKPSFGVSTQDAYGRFTSGAGISGINYLPQSCSFGELTNDLERPVFAKHRFLAELKQWLLDHPSTTGALMSGSGSTVFAVLEDISQAEEVCAEALAALDPHLWSWSGFTGD
ncbi:MAG: 4-(cytidine 5'-diphospho)-2-C-methyl-D-erythritol kinase [Verrucomicrobiaceae bacterium]|nr:MAG: 4-(cytidine 5'-diphospho)-2-C-methyl-D-erythritol kinase [Verrucomicrobiaceae bacterium]